MFKNKEVVVLKKKKESQVLLFLGSRVFFFVLFCFFKNVGSGLILGSVGLRQYNNFFFFGINVEIYRYRLFYADVNKRNKEI